ncbi:MAG: hypothetical protein K8J31_14030, partial [Anaerolineae bacterium]|nr:hypothetical protein [Anaerolineae bacterium]
IMDHAKTLSTHLMNLQNNAHSLIKMYVIILAVMIGALALRPEPYAMAAPLIDDGYYAFSVSRNIALGKGITIDGEHLTNGFQPLFVFLTIPLFLIAGEDRMLAVRFVVGFQWFVYLSSAYVLALLVRDFLAPQSENKRKLAFYLTMFVYLVSLHILLNYLNGLETGLTLFMYLLVWRFYQTGREKTLIGLLVFGMILGLLVLTRIDAAIFVVVFTLFYLVSRLREGLFSAFQRATFLGITALLVSSPWWFFNLTQFGALLPSSGQALQVGSGSFYESTMEMRVRYALTALLKNTMPAAYFGNLDENIFCDLIRLVLTIVVIALAWRLCKTFVVQAANNTLSVAQRRTIYFGLCLLLFSVLLIIWYTTQLVAGWFYDRYFTPISLLSAIIIVLVLRWLFTRLPRISLALCSVLALISIGLLGLSHFGKSFTGESYWNQISLVSDYVPSDAVVGAPQSGTLGYFRDRIVNLDGKVNTDVFDYIESGTAWQYLQEQNIEWVSDAVDPVRLLFRGQPEQFGWQLVDVRGNFLLYHHIEGS